MDLDIKEREINNNNWVVELVEFDITNEIWIGINRINVPLKYLNAWIVS